MPDAVRPAARVAAIKNSLAPLRSYLDVWDELRRQPGVCDFVLGNPQEMPLPGFVDAIRRHANPQDKDWFAYKRSEPEARDVVAKALREWRGLPFEPEDVALTPGAFGALETAFRAFLDPGDEVVFSLPPWFIYEPMLLSVDAVPVKVRVRSDDHDLDLDAIGSAIGPQTRAVIVNTPNNPTGRIYPPQTLAALATLLTDASHHWGKPIWLISDEPYARLVFSDAEFHSPSEFYSHTLISYSYGKVLLTPGERIGWLALSPSIPNREPFRETIELSQIAAGWLFPNAVLQYALDDLERLSIDLVDLQAKRDRLAGELTASGYQLRVPEGTFYLWVRSPEPDDVAFCRRLADRNVLILPGTIFEVPGHFRISLTASNDMIDRALPVFHAAVRERLRG
ncbi:MAG TPA: aminotransferase class I/II-fold pyridoxal phosphate-dependent enzyme [Jiangellaceae bacterium]|nr:aminotransferase class I/II-fold pyridoxal phosphate-dependent enzyme [Jiangellaceae bacterium]